MQRKNLVCGKYFVIDKRTVRKFIKKNESYAAQRELVVNGKKLKHSFT